MKKCFNTKKKRIERKEEMKGIQERERENGTSNTIDCMADSMSNYCCYKIIENFAYMCVKCAPMDLYAMVCISANIQLNKNAIPAIVWPHKLHTEIVRVGLLNFIN